MLSYIYNYECVCVEYGADGYKGAVKHGLADVQIAEIVSVHQRAAGPVECSVKEVIWFSLFRRQLAPDTGRFQRIRGRRDWAVMRRLPPVRHILFTASVLTKLKLKKRSRFK